MADADEVVRLRLLRAIPATFRRAHTNWTASPSVYRNRVSRASSTATATAIGAPDREKPLIFRFARYGPGRCRSRGRAPMVGDRSRQGGGTMATRPKRRRPATLLTTACVVVAISAGIAQ